MPATIPLPERPLAQFEPRPGFADPVFDSQSVFRSVMQALAEPGLPRVIDATILTALDVPVPLKPAAAAILLALADYETPVWLDTPARGGEVAAFLGFHTGCPIVADPAKASFAAITDAAALAEFDGFALGSLEYPDRSTTLILQVASLSDGPAWTLIGPGIDAPRTVTIGGLHPGLLPAIVANRAQFPRGVDLLFTDGSMILGLPRSTHVEGAD